MAGELEELIAASRPKPAGKPCWRQHLTGTADEYMSAIEAIRDEEGLGALVGTQVHQIVSDNFGVTVGVHRVRDHLAGRCKCQK